LHCTSRKLDFLPIRASTIIYMIDDTRLNFCEERCKQLRDALVGYKPTKNWIFFTVPRKTGITWLFCVRVRAYVSDFSSTPQTSNEKELNLLMDDAHLSEFAGAASSSMRRALVERCSTHATRRAFCFSPANSKLRLRVRVLRDGHRPSRRARSDVCILRDARVCPTTCPSLHARLAWFGTVKQRITHAYAGIYLFSNFFEIGPCLTRSMSRDLIAALTSALSGEWNFLSQRFCQLPSVRHDLWGHEVLCCEIPIKSPCPMLRNIWWWWNWMWYTAQVLKISLQCTVFEMRLHSIHRPK
jgi:hypothetical protein